MEKFIKKLLLLALIALSSSSMSAWPKLQDFQPNDQTRSYLNKAAGATALGVTLSIAASHAAPYAWFLSDGVGGSLGPEIYFNHHNFLKAGAFVGAGLGLKSLVSDNTFIKKNLPYASIALAPLLLSNFKNLNNLPQHEIFLEQLTPSFGALKVQIVAGLAAASYANYLNASTNINEMIDEYDEQTLFTSKKAFLRASQIGRVYLGAATMHYLFTKTIATIWNAFNS